MTNTEAGSCTFTFGSYDGQTVEEVSRSDAGLRYLDWLRDQKWFKGPKYKHIRKAVEKYLSSDAVARELRDLIGDNE